ncbi:DUF4157 domain-containing protein [Microbacterium sp. B2969]|uniref:DUF4157 domain-containing protein n=1 Tax=Microbacterium alkaliflavum TaxID=3248839 RepID=A0ABW7Q8Q4_9MICO
MTTAPPEVESKAAPAIRPATSRTEGSPASNGSVRRAEPGWDRLGAASLATSLAVSSPGDQLEREAERAADRLLGGQNDASRSPAEVEGADVQRTATTSGPARVDADPTPTGPGRPLPAAVRAWAEPRLSPDLSRVRVHADGAAAAAAAQVSADAFTVGDHITFGAGRFAPDSLSGRRLIAHELAHVVQSSSTSRGRVVHRQPHDTNPPVEPDLSAQEAALRDPNLIAHWKALEGLATTPSARAFDLILTRIEDLYDAQHALDAALVFFIFQPDLALSRLDAATAGGSQAPTAVTALTGLLASRGGARGPAVDTAYRKLDEWILAKDRREGGALTRVLQRRQIKTTVERLRATIAKSYWIKAEKLPGAAIFVAAADTLLAGLATRPESEITTLHAAVLAADPVVIRVERRLDALFRRRVSLIVDEHVPVDSDEIRFIDEELIRPYDAVLAKGTDFAAMAPAAATADAVHRDQASRYQARKIKQLRGIWSVMEPPGGAWPVKDNSGLRAGAETLYTLWEKHHENLKPRMESLLTRHESGERLPLADVAEIQRDLLTLQIEHAAVRDYISMFLLYEEMWRIEPKGVSRHVVLDFEDLKTNALSFAITIRKAVTGGDLKPYVALTENVEFRVIFDLAKSRAEAIQDEQLALEIGVLALSFLAGFGVGLLARGGAALAFGAEAIEAGTLGARALAGAEFVGNVTAFTLSNEALNSAAFGTKFDVAGLPSKLAENAIMFAVFGGVSKLTAGIGKEAATSLEAVLGFSARHGLNIALFTGVGALGQRVFHGQFPSDWKRFLIQSVASYAMLAALGAALDPLRMQLDAKTLGPIMAKRMASLEARQEALGKRLHEITGGESAEAGATKAEAEALRKQIKELIGDYGRLLDFLKAGGHLKASDADLLRDALAGTEKALNDAVLSAERARIVSLDRLPDLMPTGDGITYRYPARKPAKTKERGGRPKASGLDKALAAFGEAKFEIEINAESGEISVFTPGRGELAARFVPDLAAIPDAASEPGKAPRRAKDLRELLRRNGFEEWEIVGLGDADAKSLRAHNADRVARLMEKLTLADIRALARALFESDTVLTERMTKQILEHVEAGRMQEFLEGHEAAARTKAGDAGEGPGAGTEVDAEHAAESGLAVLDINVRKPRQKGTGGQPPLWRLAELHTGVALSAQFGGEWSPARRFEAPGTEKGEAQLSTVPDFYRESSNTAAEVKRWDLTKMGIDPQSPAARTKPTSDSVDALRRAASQLGSRRWNLPGHEQGVTAAEQWLVLDVRGQGLTDVGAAKGSINSLLTEYNISYDKVMVLTKNGLVIIK